MSEEKIDWDDPNEPSVIVARFLDEFKRMDKEGRKRMLVILKVLTEKENDV